MLELIYKFPNPYNSCEEIYRCVETGRYYALLPFTPYSKQLCTCSHHKGYYEAECPVSAGLTFKLGDVFVTTAENGEIIDTEKKKEFENQKMTFFRIKTEYADRMPKYDHVGQSRLYQKLYDYMDPAHFDQVVFSRKDVFCMMGSWYAKPGAKPESIAPAT